MRFGEELVRNKNAQIPDVEPCFSALTTALGLLMTKILVKMSQLQMAIVTSRTIDVSTA